MRAASVPKEATQAAVETTEPMRDLRKERGSQSGSTRAAACGLGADIGGDWWGGLRSGTLNVVHPVRSREAFSCARLLKRWWRNFRLRWRKLLLYW